MLLVYGVTDPTTALKILQCTMKCSKCEASAKLQ